MVEKAQEYAIILIETSADGNNCADSTECECGEAKMEIALVIGVGLIVVIIMICVVGNTKERKGRYYRARNEVVRTVLVDSSHTATARTKATSAAARGAIGGALFGPLGMVAGAVSGKKKVTEHHTTTFLVYYRDGTRETETVENGTELYNLYMNKLDVRQFVG
jgi:hypothetical protein